MKNVATVLCVTVMALVLGSAAEAQKGDALKSGSITKLTKEDVKRANGVARFAPSEGYEDRVKGPLDGTACATKNRSTSSTQHSNQPVACTVGGQNASCTCDMSCTNVCSNNVFSSDCSVSNCKVLSVDDGGNTTKLQVQPEF
jgi:hypothetical protein